MLTVKITIQDLEEAPPPRPSPVVRLPRSWEDISGKTYCSLCSKEGFISSLFSLQFTLCPLCKGKKYTLAPVKAKNGLAGAVTYLKASGLLNPYITVILVITIALGLSLNAVWEAVKASLVYPF